MFGMKSKPVPQVPVNTTQNTEDDVVMHTMRDDLDVVEGKVAAPQQTKVDTQPTGSDKIFQTGNNLSAGNKSAGLVRSATSPFMELSQQPAEQKPASKEAVAALNSEIISEKKDVSSLMKPAVPGVSSSTDPKKTAQQNPPAQASSSSAMLMIGAGALTVFVFSIAGYYFFITRTIKEEPQPPVVIEEPPVQEEPVKIEPKEPKFSVDKPNYFRIDVLNGTAESTQKLFAEKSLEVIDEKISSPLEFIVVDENNNPVPFSLFAAISGIKLPKTIIDNLGEYFLYLYNDNGNMRMGLNVKIKQGVDISKDITKEEPKLAEDLKAIMLKPFVADKTKVFKSTPYKDFSVRYLNLDPEITLSIDYTITNGSWVIGTSMKTGQAILDK